MNNISKTEEIKRVIKKMPYFTIKNLSSLGFNDYYLRITLSRLKKRKELTSLKRGVYVSKEYLDEIRKRESWNSYLEFLSSVIYSPSYLTSEYVLSEHNVLSESFFAFSAISTKKTNCIRNELGEFYYYSIKEDLFCGFKVKKKGDFFVYKATLGKAFFDFLYLRKNIVTSNDFLESLRINRDQINRDDFEEFNVYVEMEGSKKMKKIAKFYER